VVSIFSMKQCFNVKIRIFRHHLTNGGEVRPTRQPAALCPPGTFLVLISVRGQVHSTVTVQLERLGQVKNPMTSQIEPVTFRLVAL
jgi:hypothetical protein